MNKKNNFLVRVQCATYNHVHYITDALDGFCMQQTNFPFVCTIIDDASTDGEQEVIKKYIQEHFDIQDSSVAYEKDADYGNITFAQHKTNKNCYFAVICLKENHYSQKKSKKPYITEWADTKYEALCEGDDYWIDPMKLQKQVDFLEEHEDYGFVGTNVLLNKSGTIVKEPSVDMVWGMERVKEEDDFVLFGDVFDYAKYGPVARTVTLLYRQELISRFGHISGDVVLNSVLAKLSKYACLKQYASVYRQGVGITAPGDLNRELMYNELYVKFRRDQNRLLPDDCHWNEDELNDRGTYIRLKYAIKEMDWRRAVSYKNELKTTVYRRKFFSRFLCGPFSCFFLRLISLYKMRAVRELAANNDI